MMMMMNYHFHNPHEWLNVVFYLKDNKNFLFLID